CKQRQEFILRTVDRTAYCTNLATVSLFHGSCRTVSGARTRLLPPAFTGHDLPRRRLAHRGRRTAYLLRDLGAGGVGLLPKVLDHPFVHLFDRQRPALLPARARGFLSRPFQGGPGTRREQVRQLLRPLQEGGPGPLEGRALEGRPEM